MPKTSKYEQNKERIRQKAIEWQCNYNNINYSYGELAEYENYFYKQAKRYGLVKEFKENAII